MSLKEHSSEKKVDLLSDYNIRGIIGKGTFSVVKLGEHKKTKEKVAIKILQKNKILNKEDLLRIQREIEILKRLKHPNVIKIHRIEEDEKKFYIIMEFCENGELFNRIVEKRNLTEDEAAIFYYQLINGLEYIHKNNIVHRDLKPENLLLSKNDLLKIIDFGLSNYTGFNILLGTPCGSPCYASPEMVSGQRYDGYMIDVWSTGIILFAMVNGYLPFEDNDNEILFGKILKCKINYPKHMGGLTLDLMKKIITPDPKKRITLEQIKQHPFYLKGKYLFNVKYPELIDEVSGENNNVNNNNKDLNNNLPIKEIIIKNVTPIVKTKILKDIKENKEKNNNNYNAKVKKINKNLPLDIKEINNIPQIYTAKVNSVINYPVNIKDNTERKVVQIKPTTNIKQKGNITGRDYLLDTPSSLKSDEIPRDSEPIEFSGEKNNVKKKEMMIDIKKDMKEELNTINLTDQNKLKTYKMYKFKQKGQNVKVINKDKEKEILDRFEKVTKNLGEKINIVNKARTKEKDKKKLNNVKYIASPLNKINEQFVDNLYTKENMNSTLDNSTTIATKMNYYSINRNNINENTANKYSCITHKIDKKAYLLNKSNQTYDETNNKLNSPLTKITQTFSKRLQRKPVYGIIQEKENNNNNINIEGYMNLTNGASPNFVKMNTKLNNYIFDEHNHTMQENNNNKNIKKLFNQFQLTTNNNKTLNNDADKMKSINANNNTIKINERNIEKPLIIGKNKTQIIRKDMNKIKELNKFNNYINPKDTKDKINRNTDRDHHYATKSKNLNQNSKNQNTNNPPINNNKIYISNNSTNFKGVSPINDKYFDSITINNNNNINLHEPKLYIYVQNNNNSINSHNPRLKSELNQNKTKVIFKFDKKNNNAIKNITKINSVEYNKIVPGKRLNSNITENRTIDNNLEIKRIHKITPIKNNHLNNTKNYKDNKTTEKTTMSKKIYNSIEPDKNFYKLKDKDIIFNNTKRIKDNNMKYIISKNNANNNMYFEKVYNTVIDKSFDNNNINYVSKVNNNTINTSNNYIYQNTHNTIKSDTNIDLWNYDNVGILNNDNNIIMPNYNNNSQRMTKGENINYDKKINYENIDYTTKKQKQQTKNYITNLKENTNLKYEIPYNSNTIDSNDYRRINPILSDNLGTSIIKQNYKNMINYKPYMKRY